jgi:hypothetical protein
MFERFTGKEMSKVSVMSQGQNPLQRKAMKERTRESNPSILGACNQQQQASDWLDYSA